MLSQDDRNLLDFLNSTYDYNVSEDEFSDFLSQYNQLHYKLKTEHSLRLSQQGIDYIPDVENTAGQGIGAALGIAVGVALSFTGIGSAIGILTLVAIGASVGYQLGTLLDPPSLQAQKDQKSNKQKEARNAYGFDSVSTLVTYGEPIPAIYTNRSVNPNGGIRTTGYLIDQRVDTRNGAQTLVQKYILCEGAIGAIAEQETLFDNQGIDTFFRNEITQEFRLGYDDQLPFSDAGIYSNAVTLSANSTCGCDLRSLVESTKIKRRDILAEPERMVNGFDATRRTKTIDFRKNGGTVAEFTSVEALKNRNGKPDSGFVEATILRPNFPHTIGLTSRIDPPNSGYADIPFAFRLPGDNTCHVRVNGVNVYSVGAIGRNTALAVEYLGRSVYFRVNKSVVYVASVAPVYPVRLMVQIFDGGSGGDADDVQVNKLYFARNISYAKGRIRPSDTTIIEVNEDDIEKFTPSDIYKVRGKRFQITGKNPTAGTITVDGVLNLREDDEVYAVWEASFETSRKVTRIDVNVAARLWARNPRGELIRHGMVFDVWIKPDGHPFQFLQRFYLSNNVDVDIRRAFKIKNLPLNYYQVELRPVERPNDAYTIEKLGETDSFQTWNVGTIGANQVTIEAQLEDRPSIEAIQKACDFEGLFDDVDDDADMDEDELKGRKRSVCTQQGATLRITTINEIVNGPQLNYPGLVLARVTLKASERMTSSPTPSFLITKGIIDRIHVATGNVSNSGDPFTFQDLTANFVSDAVQVGWMIRNLDSYQESTIADFTATTITASAAIGWSRGDRYLVYYRDSCNYFPDIYASRLGKEHGVAAQFNTDEFIHYPSFIKSLKFVRARRFFCDCRFKEQMKLNQWVGQEALASLLINAMIDGMRALAPEQDEPVQGLFTGANAENWGENTIEFTKRQTNRVVVTFTDGSDDYKLKTAIIMTPDAYHKRVPWCEENVTYTSITYRQQAVYVGALLLKSRMLQDRVSDWESGLYGLAVQPAGLVHAQHTVTEWLDEKSGLILSVVPQPGVPGNYFLETSFPIETTVTRSAYRATVQYRSSGNVDFDLFCYTVATAPLHKVVIGGGAQAPQPGDFIALGEDREKKRTFRVSAIEPTEQFGQLKMNAIVWTKELLTLDGLFVDGVCQGARSGDSVINDAEMRSWLAGMDSWLTSYTRDVEPSVMNSDYLLVNAFHNTLGRGGYFESGSATSESEFIGIRTCCLLYQITGNESWRQRAINMGNAAIAFLYQGVPIPTNTNTMFAPHWLIAAKRSFTTKGLVPTKPINMGRFDTTITFTNGLGTIPSGGSTRGEFLSDVYAVYSTDGKLLWKNIYAPVIRGTEYMVQYWTSNYQLNGQTYRVYPTTASSAGTAPTLTGESPGQIRLTTNYSGQARLVYLTYEPSIVIQKNEGYEAFPGWRKLLDTEISAATDAFPWAYQSFNLLNQITYDEKWLRAREATKYTSIQAAQIANLSHYFKKSDNPEVFSYAGSQTVIVNRAENTVTASRVTSGDKKDFVRLDLDAVSTSAFASVELQNFAVHTALSEAVEVIVETAIQENTPGLRQLEVVLSLSSDPFDQSRLYKAYFALTSDGETVTKRFEVDDFHNWDASIAKGNIIWYHSIAASPLYTYQGDGGTAVATKENASIKSNNALASKITLDGNGGYAGAGFVFAGLGASTNTPPCLYLNHQGDTVSLRITDGSGRKWETFLEESDGWVKRSFNWADLRRAAEESGSEDPNTTDPIQSIELQSIGNSESTTLVWYISKSDSVTPDVMPVPGIAFKAAVVNKIASANTWFLGTFRPANNNLDQLPFVPGVLPFTLNLLQNSVDAWRGIPLSGYQDSSYWVEIGLTDYADRTLQFLQAAQDSYFAQTGIDGGFAPSFSWNYWDSSDFLSNGINSFGWSASDPNTEWEGYQHRPLAAVAHHWFLNPSSALAGRITMRFLTYLYNLFEANNVGQPPTNYPRGNPSIQYHTPHGAALIARAALYGNLAGGDPEITYKVLERSYLYLRSQYVSIGNMTGSFTASQPQFLTGVQQFAENFGFWHMEEGFTIGELIRYRDRLRYPCG